MQAQEAKDKTNAEPTRRPLRFLNPCVPIGVPERRNNGCVQVGENNKEEQFNDFVPCLGYLPDRIRKPVREPETHQEELNDFILCLGYGAEKQEKSSARQD